MGKNVVFKNLLKKQSGLAQSMRMQRWLLAAGFFIVILTILYVTLVAARVELELGRPSPLKIVAEWDAIDYYTTNQLRDEAAQAVEIGRAHV